MSAEKATEWVNASGPELRQLDIMLNTNFGDKKDAKLHSYFDIQNMLNRVNMPADSHNPDWLTANARGSMEGVVVSKRQ